MRVLYVNQTAQVSGAERSLLSLLQGLEHTVEPLVACPPGELTDLLHSRGIEPWPIAGTGASFRLHPWHTTRGVVEIASSSLQVRNAVRRLGPDLVHANTTRAALLALLARRRGGPPVVAHIRDWVPEGRFSRAVLGLVAARADLVVANSAFVAAQFEGMAARAPVRVLHNPVDLGRFDPTRADGAGVRRDAAIPEGRTVLSVIAQLTPWKGQDDAIRALAELVAAGQDPILLLAGSAKFAGAGTQFDNAGFERRLHELAAELGVADRVRFLGERDDVPAVLAATDMLLVPSWREAFGRIVVEGMAMGVPVAATEAGGPAEIVRAGEGGLLLPPRRPDLWAEALLPLVADPRRRAELGIRGRRRAADFGIEAHAEQALALYRELVAPQRPGQPPL